MDSVLSLRSTSLFSGSRRRSAQQALTFLVQALSKDLLNRAESNTDGGVSRPIVDFHNAVWVDDGTGCKTNVGNVTDALIVFSGRENR